MLQLQTENIDICRISKILAKYNIKASITDSVITLDGDISSELLTKLCDCISINKVQNFISQESLNVPKEISFDKSEECIKTEIIETTDLEKAKKVEEPQSLPAIPKQSIEYDLLYSVVKRGEVYMCDFGEPYGSEQGFEKYAIVVQNDYGNLHSPTTIVIACTTEQKKKLPVHFHCNFSSSNMIDYDESRVSSSMNVIMTEQIFTVDKTRLRKYIGILTTEFMKSIEEKINISLHLSTHEVKTIEKTVYVDSPVPLQTIVAPEKTKERKDLNLVQVQLLSFVDINELLKISLSNTTDEIKAQKILELFGFDFKRNGVTYLLKAIIASPKDVYFNLETLTENISRTENIDKEEIQRLIIARVKERFCLRKTPTIDFIRLVNIFLLKQEI